MRNLPTSSAKGKPMTHQQPIISTVLVLIALLIASNGLAQTTGAEATCPLGPPEPAAVVTGDGTIITESGVLLDIAGEPRLLTDAANVSWAGISDDGTVVAYIRNIWMTETDRHRLEVWAVNSDGSNDRMLASTEQLTALRQEPFAFTAGIVSIAWIPLSHSLALNIGATPLGEGIHNSIADDLWEIDVDRGTISNILPQGEGGKFHYSPDSQSVLIQTPSTAWLMRRDGSDRRPINITNYQALGMGHSYFYPPTIWESNTSLLMAVSSGVDPYSQNAGEVSVWRVSVVGEPLHISTFPAYFASFSFSSNARWVAYWLTVQPGQDNRELHVAGVDGEPDRVVFTGEVLEFVQWLDRDSRYFLYREHFQQAPKIGDVCGESHEMANG
jgi:hypothetical protein